MAKLPAIIDAIARRDGRERGQLEQYARLIREAGFVQTTKRGRGAADMTGSDIANLLIGMSCAETPSDAARLIPQFRSLSRNFVAIDDGVELPVLNELQKIETFGEALALLVENFGEVLNAAQNFISAGYTDPAHINHLLQWLQSSRWDEPFSFEITLRRFAADIEIKTWGADSERFGVWRTRFHARYIQNAELMVSGFYPGSRGDRVVTVTLNGRLLLELWKALIGEQPEEVVKDPST